MAHSVLAAGTPGVQVLNLKAFRSDAVLEHVLAPALAPSEIAREAAALELRSITVLLRSTGVFQCSHDLVADEGGRAGFRSDLRNEGVAVACATPFFITPRRRSETHQRALAAAAEVGARGVIGLAYDFESEELACEIAQFSALAAAEGLDVLLEPFLPSAIPTLDVCTPLIRRIGAANLGVCADLLHLTRAGTSFDRCVADRDLIRYAQISDGPLLPTDTLVDEATRGRRAPGEGAFDIAGFLQNLPEHVPVGIEVPCPEASRADQRLHLRRTVARTLVFAS